MPKKDPPSYYRDLGLGEGVIVAQKQDWKSHRRLGHRLFRSVTGKDWRMYDC
jgi:hypothetical protein